MKEECSTAWWPLTRSGRQIGDVVVAFGLGAATVPMSVPVAVHMPMPVGEVWCASGLGSAAMPLPMPMPTHVSMEERKHQTCNHVNM
jgi:hypothetical protein